METSSLIVPVAADKPEYTDSLPYVFGFDDDGIIICIKSMLGLNLDAFSHIYFTILRKHDERFFLSEALRLQFRRLGLKNAEVVVLDKPTEDQAETVYQTIQLAGISGPVFIKDGDCYFKADVRPVNSVAIFPIEELPVLDPRDKSYVVVDDMNYVTNIIEKRVVGHFISAGGYSIESAEDFCRYYLELRGFGKLYLSHIIYSMLLDKVTFRPEIVSDYKDWGTGNLYVMNK